MDVYLSVCTLWPRPSQCLYTPSPDHDRGQDALSITNTNNLLGTSSQGRAIYKTTEIPSTNLYPDICCADAAPLEAAKHLALAVEYCDCSPYHHHGRRSHRFSHSLPPIGLYVGPIHTKCNLSVEEDNRLLLVLRMRCVIQNNKAALHVIPLTSNSNHHTHRHHILIGANRLHV